MIKSKTLRRLVIQIAFYVCLILFWQLAYYAGVELKWWRSYSFPSPAGVWASLLAIVKKGTLPLVILSSMKRAAIGYGLSVVIGFALGFLLAYVKSLQTTLRQLLLGFQTLPSICWVPFSILWFGLKESAIIFVIVIGSAFGIAIATDSAIRNVPVIYVKAAKTMGAKGAALWLKVIAPASLPMIVSGLKQGWSFAWRALMAGEVMSATIGLGQTLILGRDLADINRVALVMLIIIIIGVIVDRAIFGNIENYLLKRVGLESIAHS